MTVTKLFSGIGLPHRNDLTVKGALRVDDDDHSALKQSKADDPYFTVVPSSVHEFKCWTGKDPFGIEEVQPPRLQGADALMWIKSNHQGESAG